jgi:hypothetical protein
MKGGSESQSPPAFPEGKHRAGIATPDPGTIWPESFLLWSKPPSHKSSSSATRSASSSAPSSFSDASTVRHSDRSPSLADLGLAAFLEGLDTLDINPEDGLTPNMLQNLNGVGSGPLESETARLDSTLLAGIAAPSQLSFSSLIDGQSFAVPSDLSWADSSWLSNPAISSKNTLTSSTESCCGSAMPPALAPPPEARKEVCPKTGQSTCCCGESSVPSILPRVHCVPNPTGDGCTCLCDVGVALINIRATLRQAKDQTLTQEPRQGAAASTLQLTLSASQAIADQCACSASCPTCRSDPSTSLSASLLVSTALQIYIRAVRTLRQGFGAGAHERYDAEKGGSEWDVSIGQYKPKPGNARRIALFAMKLELIDLRDAIRKICTAASAAVTTSEEDESSATTPPSGIVEGFDQVVIRKLYTQIQDLLRTVEAIEQQHDGERV